MSKQSPVARVRSLLGLAALDIPVFIARTLSPGDGRRSRGWCRNRNRIELVEAGPDGDGIHVHGAGTRALRVASKVPALGSFLIRKMLREWPIRWIDGPAPTSVDDPRISFVIPHRGRDRLQHLAATIASLRGQIGIPFEVIVVEQDVAPSVRDQLPLGIRWEFDHLRAGAELFNRASALNRGALAARGEILVLHDGDFVVPAEYASEIARAIDLGAEVANLKRFVAYLDEASTARMFREGGVPGSLDAEEIIGNLIAGGSIAIRRDAYLRIGGMDERFVGWGGEDEEFWDRCSTLRVSNAPYMPVLHAWHAPQPGKRAVRGRGEHTVEYFEERMAIPVQARIRELASRLAVPMDAR